MSVEHPVLVEAVPSAGEYRQLRRLCGWHDVDEPTCQEGLSRSFCAFTARSGSATIGMVRVVGDGAVYCYVQDLIVSPSFQCCGVGTMLLKRAVDHIALHAPIATLGLMAAAGTTEFYQRRGFAVRATNSPGMTLASKRFQQVLSDTPFT